MLASGSHAACQAPFTRSACEVEVHCSIRADYEVSFASLVDKLSNGARTDINETGVCLCVRVVEAVRGKRDQERGCWGWELLPAPCVSVGLIDLDSFPVTVRHLHSFQAGLDLWRRH